MSIRRLIKDLGNLDFAAERSLLSELAPSLGAVCVRPDNAMTRPISPAQYALTWSERPVLISWAGEAEQIRDTWDDDRPHRRVWNMYAEVITGVSTPLGPSLPAAANRSQLALQQHQPGAGDPAKGRHFVATVPREKLVHLLPPSGFDATPTCVITRTLLTGTERVAAAAGLRRALDRGGWMAWSLEHGADLPTGLVV